VRPFPTRITGPLTVVGDLHGQADALDRLLARLRGRPDFAGRWLVFVGDFADRGPDSRRVLDAVVALRRRHARTTAVMSNHDLALAAALGLIETPAACDWPRRYVDCYDSGSTFQSYGVARGDLPGLAAAMPAAHRTFLAGLPWRVEHPEYLIVHAGLLPGVPFADQLASLRTPNFADGRPAWLSDRSLAREPVPADCPLTVVSGHVPVPAVAFADRRVLVDTTGGVRGDLSAVLLPERLVVTSAASGG
jgi:serine/threonine protein phosphatase 1